jgi:hypothetical protein
LRCAPLLHALADMRLRDARLCLDCDEVHDATLCPACGSESFTYLSRWVPLPDSERPQRPQPTEQANVYRALLEGGEPPSRGRKFLKNGLLGLTALGIAGWAWRSHRNNGKSSRVPE